MQPQGCTAAQHCTVLLRTVLRYHRHPKSLPGVVTEQPCQAKLCKSTQPVNAASDVRQFAFCFQGVTAVTVNSRYNREHQRNIDSIKADRMKELERLKAELESSSSKQAALQAKLDGTVARKTIMEGEVKLISAAATRLVLRCCLL